VVAYQVFMLKEGIAAGYAVSGVNKRYKIVPKVHQFTLDCLNLRFIKF
jgi:hypothetical protein